MANFMVFTDVEGSYDNYADGSTYTFNEAGLLVVTRPDRERITYSPGGWTKLVDTAPEAKVRVAGRIR